MIGIVSGVIKLLLPLLGWWVKKNAKNEAMTKAYYEFLKQIDAAGALNVKNYLKVEEVRDDVASKIREERLKREASKHDNNNLDS